MPRQRGRDGWPAHLLFLGGGKEAHHLHGLLESFKVMFQVFSIFDLQVMLKNKVIDTLGISGSERVAVCGNGFGWNDGAGPRTWGMNGLLYAASCGPPWSQSGGRRGPRQDGL